MCTGLFHEKFESRFRQWFISIDPETLQTLLSAFEGQTIRFTKNKWCFTLPIENSTIGLF